MRRGRGSKIVEEEWRIYEMEGRIDDEEGENR
jgi:hypothetical protein